MRAWSGLTCQGSDLTGQARSLACQAGLTGRLAFGSPAVVDCKNGYSKGENKKLFHFPTDKDMVAVDNLNLDRRRSTRHVFGCIV